MKKLKCENCDKQFKTKKQLLNHELNAHKKTFDKKNNNLNIKKIKNWAITCAVLFVFIWGISAVLNQPKLPPTSMQGHVEQNPKSHVLKEQMSDAVQRHMLEHADGVDGGPGGIIINYNCKDFDCDKDLIFKLEDFAREYPENVYVSPYKNLKHKIVLTKLGKIDVLDEYDETRIKIFIEG